MKLLASVWGSDSKVVSFVKTILVPVVVWRVALFLVMSWAFWLIPHMYDFPELHVAPQWLEHISHWDGIWYTRIIERGYGGDLSTYGPTVAYFPLFPLLVAGAMKLGLSKLVAVLMVNLFATLGGAWFLTKIAEEILPKAKANRVLWLWLAFPSAFFLGVMYTEALFCLTVFGAFWAFLKGKPTWVGIFALLASMTRISGLFVGAVLGIAYLTQRKWWNGIYTGLMAAAGVGLFMAYLQYKVGDPLAFVTIHDTYFTNEHATLNVVATLKDWFSAPFTSKPYDLFLYGIPVVAYLFAWTVTIMGARKLPWFLTAFSATNLLFFLITDASGSMLRYILPLFPMYLTLALVQSKEMNRAWLIGGSIVASMGAVLFATWYWAA